MHFFITDASAERATTLHTTELVQAATRSTHVVRAWGMFERGVVERSKSWCNGEVVVIFGDAR